jgi:hypothetical protein
MFYSYKPGIEANRAYTLTRGLAMDQGMATATKKIRSQIQGNFHGEGSVDAIHSVFYKGGIRALAGVSSECVTYRTDFYEHPGRCPSCSSR